MGTYVHIHVLRKYQFIMWSVYTLLYADLSYALMRLNSRGTLEMHNTSKLVVSAHSVNCQPHVAHHMNKLIMSAPYMHHTNKFITSAHLTIQIIRGTPDMHHMNKLFMSASSLYELPLLRSTTIAILLNEKSSL